MHKFSPNIGDISSGVIGKQALLHRVQKLLNIEWMMDLEHQLLLYSDSRLGSVVGVVLKPEEYWFLVCSAILEIQEKILKNQSASKLKGQES